MYRLIIVHKGDDAWAAEVDQAVRSMMDEIGVPSEALDTVDPSEMNSSDLTTVVYLASKAAAGDPEVDLVLKAAVAAAHSVMPVHRDNTDIPSVMPPSMHALIAVNWSGAASRVALGILRGMGLADDVRRLFLSYRRSETSEIAVQLQTELSHRGFDVFLDRFSVPWGADFQRRIVTDLADKAFVLFLESPGVGESRWVEEEVTYAMSHRISHLALTTPDTTEDERFPTVDNAFRMQLHTEDFDRGTLNEAALRKVLDEVETRYAGSMRNRRNQILGTLTELLTALGHTVTVAGDWALLGERDGEPHAVYLTTPRAPTPRDLHVADHLRAPLVSASRPTVDAFVVHMVADLDDETKALVEWVGLGCGLATRFMDGTGLHG